MNETQDKLLTAGVVLVCVGIASHIGANIESMNATMVAVGILLFITVCAMPLLLIALTKKEKFVPDWSDAEDTKPQRFIVVDDRVSLPAVLKQLEVSR